MDFKSNPANKGKSSPSPPSQDAENELEPAASPDTGNCCVVETPMKPDDTDGVMSKIRQNEDRMNVMQAATEETQVAVAALSDQLQDLTGQLMTLLNAIPTTKAQSFATGSPTDSEMVSKDAEPVSLGSKVIRQDTTEPVDSKVVCQDTTPRGLTPKTPATNVQPINLSQ